MAKGPWESRVGKLLVPPDFVWSYKAPDSTLYGGKPRVDWVACDYQGRFWMIEVKQIAEDRRSINLRTDVSPGQVQALNAVASGYGVALLAIGQGTNLFVHAWRAAWSQNVEALKLLSPSLIHIYQWSGPKRWKEESLLSWVLPSKGPALVFSELDPQPTQPTPTPPSGSWVSRTELASILRPEDYILTRDRVAPKGR